MNERTFPIDWLPKPTDEFVHEPTGDPVLPWKETWFLNAYDLRNSFALSLHMTLSPERSASTRVAVAIRHGGREALEVCVEPRLERERSFGNRLAQVEIVKSSWDSAHELRVTGKVEGDCEFDLCCRGHHWATLWDKMFPDFYQNGHRSSHSYGHAEQSLTVDGTINWDDVEPVQISGFGWRDRGWGRRRSTSSFSAGYDMINGVLPDDGVFTLMAFRNPDLPPESPTPVGGWFADADTLTPAVGGTFWKDSVGWPERLDLTFADGRSISASIHRRHFSIAVPFHDAAHDIVPRAHGIRDYFAEMIDADGAVFPVHANSGHMHEANVTADSAFVYTGQTP